MTSHRDVWTCFVAELALMPELIARLLDTHRPDAYGRCAACTTPGRGTPRLTWPCGPAAVAIDARALLTRQAG